MDAEATEELLEAWRTNQRICLHLLEGITDEGLAATLSTRGGRDVARQIAHVHSNRARWLDRRGAADLAEGLRIFAAKETPSREALIEALEASADAVERFFRECASGERKIRGQKKGLITSLAYHVAHESHHRGGILLTLKQCGHMPDKDAVYGIWDWHRR